MEHRSIVLVMTTTEAWDEKYKRNEVAAKWGANGNDGGEQQDNSSLPTLSALYWLRFSVTALGLRLFHVGRIETFRFFFIIRKSVSYSILIPNTHRIAIWIIMSRIRPQPIELWFDNILKFLCFCGVGVVTNDYDYYFDYEMASIFIMNSSQKCVHSYATLWPYHIRVS